MKKLLLVVLFITAIPVIGCQKKEKTTVTTIKVGNQTVTTTASPEGRVLFRTSK